MEELNSNLNTIITIVGFILTAAGLYWKVRIDLTKLDLKIAQIQCDRNERWKKYDEEKDKAEAYSSEILKAIAEMKADIKVICKSIQYLEKDK